MVILREMSFLGTSKQTFTMGTLLSPTCISVCYFVIWKVLIESHKKMETKQNIVWDRLWMNLKTFWFPANPFQNTFRGFTLLLSTKTYRKTKHNSEEKFNADCLKPLTRQPLDKNLKDFLSTLYFTCGIKEQCKGKLLLYLYTAEKTREIL
jgi:hypothetical protein